MPDRRATEEWKRFWPVVLAGSVGYSFSAFLTMSAGLFMGPLTEDFGWSRTQLSSGVTLASLILMLFGPVAGSQIDRFGSRRIAIPGIVLTASAVAAFALANGSYAQWIMLWLIWGCCALLVQPAVWSAAVAGVFDAGRGLALGLTFSGAALAQIVAPPLTNWLIATQGWRGAYVGLACGWGGVALILAVFFLYDAVHLKSRDASKSPQPAGDFQPLTGLTISQAWRDVSLWKVAISTFLILTVTVAISVHQFPILVEAGIAREHAVWLVSLTGIAAIAGKLVTGALLDRFHARWVGGLTLASTAVAYPLLVIPFSTITPIVIGIMISGYAGGTKIQLCGYLTARYAGMRSFGAIFGAMMSGTALSSSIGPLMAGVAHDLYGNYAPLLIFGTVASLISALLVLSLGPYPVWDAADHGQPNTAGQAAAI